jgi:hypothetical protein
MIKKRQVMRNTFGDYRKKMAEMEHKSTIGNFLYVFLKELCPWITVHQKGDSLIFVLVN